MTRTVLNSRRSRKTSCSILALATVLTVGATPAMAQSFLAGGTIQTNTGGSAGIVNNVPGQTNVTLNPGNTVISWLPNDNATNNNVPINFQPSGTATFTSSGNFAVLNNITVTDTSRVISMSGIVNGVVNGDQGGSIYFYSPSGFLINNGATFNVANLVLSALPITNTEFAKVGGTGYGSNIVFGQAPNANASITMNGTVNAFIPPPVGFPGGAAGNGYVAMIAPKVVLGSTGTMTVNGSAALVAAEAATMTFSTDMLFSIQVDVGTTSATGIQVNGDIKGQTPQSLTDNQRIYLVAVPKNQALTMAIGAGSDLGFTLAGGAFNDKGVVVLSAGNNISAGDIGAKSSAAGTGTASIQVGAAHFTNNVIAKATGSASFTSTAGQSTTFDNSLTAHADGDLTVSASGAGASLSVGGSLNLDANRVGGTGQSVTGGNIALSALGGGALTVGGTIGMSANATGGDSSTGTAGAGTGGTINISATGGSTLNLSSLTTASASGTGGNENGAGVNGGAGTGGSITITADTGGSVTATNPLTLNVQGFGGSGGGAGNGGLGRGGNARIEVGNNASLTFGGDVQLDANGFGGGSGSGTGGTGQGGTAALGAVAGSTSGGLMTFTGELNASAEGDGGSSNTGTAGDGRGGVSQLTSSAHHFVFNNGAIFHAGGDGGGSDSGQGGLGLGGTAEVNMTGTSELDSANGLQIDADGNAGSGAIGGTGTGGTANLISKSNVALTGDLDISANGAGGTGWTGNGGAGTGGTVNVLADGGILDTMYVNAEAIGYGGDTDGNGAVSGTGQGGSVNIEALTGGDLGIGDYLYAYADGYAGSVFGASNSANGTGGTITFKASGTGATLTAAQSVRLQANGEAGGSGDCIACGAGGDGTGGSIYSGANGTNAIFHVLGYLDATADGYGGSPADGGIGGKGTGGFAQLTAYDGGSADVDGDLYLEADGHGGGGYGGDLSTGGDGFGGAVEILTFGTGTVSLNVDGSAQISADGYGGSFSFFSGGGGNIGGDGTGGRAGTYGNAGTLSLGSLYGSGAGYGGDGSVDGSGGVGGGGFGKDAEVFASNGSTVTIGYASVNADGYGGNGDTGGDGIGGGLYDGATGTGEDGAHISAQNASIILGGASVSADGYGGDAGYYYGGGTGGDGGDGTGGWATIFAANSNAGPSSIKIQGVDSSAYVSADGHGGDGDVGLDGQGGLDGLPGTDGITGGIGGTGGNGTAGGTGGNGGDGSGGIAFAFAASGNGALTIDNLNITAIGDGGSGGSGGNGGFGGTGGTGGAGSTGAGGTGGNGGNGGAGGAGGTGGAGFGGSVNFGTSSGFAAATGSNLGVATFGNVTADATAYGGRGGSGGLGGSAGAGGAGGTGTPAGGTGLSGNFGPDGVGGDGGDATGGAVTLLVRGSTVNLTGEADLYADAFGGDGGYGGDGDGIGGDAFIGGDGGIAVLVSPRFQFPAQHGTLNAASATIHGTAIAAGGLGSADGVGTSMGGNYVQFIDSTGTIGSLDFTVGADVVGAGANNDLISITGGNVSADNFSFNTVGNLAVFIDNALFDVGSLTLGAGNFVYDGRAWTNSGLIQADDVSISSNGDFVADANWDVTNTFFANVPGLIALDTVHDDNGVDFTAGGSISITGAFSAGTYISLVAGGDIDHGDATAGSSIYEQSTGGSISIGSLTATGMVTLSAAHFINGEDITTDGAIFAETTVNGDINLEKLTSNASSVDLDAAGDINLLGDIHADQDIDLTAGDDIDVKNLVAGGLIDIRAFGDLLALDMTAGGSIGIIADNTVVAGDLTAGSELRIEAGDDVTVGHLIAGASLGGADEAALRIISDGSVSLIDINSLGKVDITAGGSVTGGNVTTGESLFTDAVGAIHYGNIAAGLVNPQSSDPASVGLDSATSITVGDVDASKIIAFVTSGTLNAGDLTTGTDVLGLVHGNMVIGNVDAGGRVLLADSAMFTDAGGTIGISNDADIDPEAIFAATPKKTGGSITVGNISAGSFTAAAGTDLTVSTLDTDNGISLDAGAAITTGNLNVGDFVLANGGSITTGTIDAFSVNMTSTGGNISTGDINATGAVSLDAFADIITGDIVGSSIDLLAGDDITTGDLTTFLPILTFGKIQPLAFAGASISLEAGGDIVTGNIDSYDGLYANAGGSLTTGLITAGDFVQLFSVGNMLTDDIDAGTYLDADAGGTMTLGDIVTGAEAAISAGGNLAFASANIGDDFDFESDASVTGGNVVAGNEITGGAGSTMTLGNLTAGTSLDGDFSIGIGAIGNLTVGNATGAGQVGFATQGNLLTGNLTGGNLVMTMVGGNTTTGSITTSAAPGSNVYMADDSMFTTGGGSITGNDNFDPNIVLALAPVPTGGSITINGNVTTGQFRAAAGTSLTTQGVTAANATASAGGTATINGAWNIGNNARLTSNDIDITSTGRMVANGTLTIASSNALQMLVGDGFTGSGYSLSNAEFGRIAGGNVAIIGRGDASSALDMLVGDLTVNNATTGHTILSPTGALVFAVGNLQTQTPGGVIRVVGDVNAPNINNGQFMEFYATRFELDSSLGSISMTSNGSTLAGELGLYAERVHVATGTILDKLAANPTYTNYQQDLNNAATGSNVHPEGVIRADTLWIESDNLQDILIQNTGTGGPSGTPAGFLVREAYINEDFDTVGPAGSVNAIVNGQLVTDSGTLTGVAVRDAAVPEGTDISAFTSNSTINGCPLTGECIIRPPAPPPTSNVVDNQIDLITNNPLGDSEFGNEDSIDDNEEGDEGRSNPISPPQPLFDTRPLIPASDVNDPVSGTGNPALLGGDEQCDADEQGQCPNPVKGDSQ